VSGSDNPAKATFGAGCFWGVEAAFRRVKGVVDVVVGYSGGDLENPTYKDVCTGKTGHAEVAQVMFDPDKVSFKKLLDVFWDIHDPMSLNRQGEDAGTQYRSAIFFHSPQQQQAARASKEKLQNSGKFKKEIVTEITAVRKFWSAEEYHQGYFEKNPDAACHINLE